jgi:hypothetical protein
MAVIVYTVLALPLLIKDVLTPCIRLDSSAPCYGTSFFVTLPGGVMLVFLRGANLPLHLQISLSFALTVLFIYGIGRGLRVIMNR